MSRQTFTPGPTPNTVRSADGTVLTAPEGWAVLPRGDAALTRRVKDAGDHWVVQEKKGRKTFSRGVWAPAATVERIRAGLEGERATDAYAKRKAADARRRDKAQAEYAEDFFGAVVAFLAFHPNHADLTDRLARAVTEHATPVGSGTVARTKRIPVEQRAEAAVIAWLRHQTTGYEGMVIARVKGRPRRGELRPDLNPRLVGVPTVVPDRDGVGGMLPNKTGAGPPRPPRPAPCERRARNTLSSKGFVLSPDRRSL
jgi:hypothetical protein